MSGKKECSREQAWWNTILSKRKPRPVEPVFYSGNRGQNARKNIKAAQRKTYLRCERCGEMAEHTVNLYTPQMRRMSYCQSCYENEYNAGTIYYVGANKVLRRDKWHT